MKKIIIFVLIAVMLLPTCLFSVSAEGEDITILFTHDLHSRLLPSIDTDGGEYGGYARLYHEIKKIKSEKPNAILVDGGDFAMGSLFQSAFTTSAIELRMMGAMGYDATTFGNHEFDYLQSGLAAMLNSAVASGDKLPAIVESNYLLPQEGKEGHNPELQAAFDNYGVEEYIILERGGAYFVIFGLMGIDSDACAPNSGMILHDMAKTSQSVVDKAVKECKDSYGADPVVVCLSHAGTDGEEGEDKELAAKVNGIDVIISAHTHTTIAEPIRVNDTLIVSAGEYGKMLGVLTLNKGDHSLKDYKLITIDENTPEDPEIVAMVEQHKATVENDYLSKYGFGFDEVILDNQIEFETIDELYATQHESTLGNLFSDAYKWAVEEATGENVDIALTATGVMRESIPAGEVTTSDVFNTTSLGVGTEGELIKVYLTGKEIMAALEVDASVQPIMRYAQLFCSGVEYSFNTKRMIFNKVDHAMLRTDSGLVELEDDKLYSVVTGMYAGQMLGEVRSKSFGLLSIVPKDRQGNPIDLDQLVNYVVKDKDGNPLKEWYAIASYMREMGGEMDEHYSQPDGRKVVYSSLNPVKLLKHANKFTYILLAVIFVVILVIALIIRKVVRSRRNGKN